MAKDGTNRGGARPGAGRKPKALKDKINIAKSKSVINFYLQAGHNSLDEMTKMMELNPISFKVFMDLETDEELDKIFKDISDLSKKSFIRSPFRRHCGDTKIH